MRSFHVEHVVAQQHRGTDDLGNLALACRLCNWFKGTNLTSLDPDTNELTRLFNPRSDVWEEHFRLVGSRVVGITGMGRTFVWLLEMNSKERITLREMLLELGEWP